MKKSLLLISLALFAGLPGCRQPKATTKSQPGTEVKRIEHPAPDQAKVDSLKEVLGKDKKNE